MSKERTRMDNRDEIIRTQMDVIGTLISNNLRSLSDDIWGPQKPYDSGDATPADGSSAAE